MRAGLFILAETMVSIKRTKVDCGKAQVREVGGHAAEDQTQIRTCSW